MIVVMRRDGFRVFGCNLNRKNLIERTFVATKIINTCTRRYVWRSGDIYLVSILSLPSLDQKVAVVFNNMQSVKQLSAMASDQTLWVSFRSSESFKIC